MITANQNPNNTMLKTQGKYGGLHSELSLNGEEIPEIFATKPDINLQPLNIYINNGTIIIRF